MSWRPLPLSVRVCLLVLAALVALCWLGPLLTRFDPHTPDWNAPSVGPGAAGHWFGTDAIGRDVFARTLAGGRLSLAVGLLASAIALGVGLAYGAIAGLAGGRVERAMVRLLDVLSAIPFLLAATAAGATFAQRLRWHVLPNLLPLAVVYLGLILPQAILVESFLGFLGLGVDEPSASLGTLLAEGVQELDSAPWTLLFPAGLLVATLAAFQFLGDALRDALDVRLRGTEAA